MNGAKHALNTYCATHAAACAGNKRQLSITSSHIVAINACSGIGPIGSLYAQAVIHPASNPLSGAFKLVEEAMKIVTHADALSPSGGSSKLVEEALGPVGE